MGILVLNSISRFAAYFKSHSFRATFQRIALSAKRTLFSSRMVVFYCDLPLQTNVAAGIQYPLELTRVRSNAELSPSDSREMTRFWNPQQAREDIRQRFEQRASLWLIKSEGNLAAYGWTLQGRTIEPHYFPLAPEDLHLFDFHVFPSFRGHGINPLLITHILQRMAGECAGRAFIEAAEWNEAQLSSLRKTPFRRMGLARKSAIFQRTFVCWDETTAIQHRDRAVEVPDVASSVARPH